MSEDLIKRLLAEETDLTDCAVFRIEQLERERPKALVFSNADATLKNVTIYTTRESIGNIIIWYGSHHGGDRYTVSFDGRNVPMDNWGWPT